MEAIHAEERCTEAGQAQLLRITPDRGWRLADFGELWTYRDLLWTLAQRDLRLRYRQTALGVVWVLFQPIAGAGVFAVVFGKVAGMGGAGVPYFIYSLAGLLVWNAFQSTLLKSSMALVGSGAIVSKVYFPRLMLPLATILSTLVDFIIGFAAFVVVGFLYGWAPGVSMIMIPFWLGVGVMTALGLGLLAASTMARFRDVQHVLPLLLPFLMYATPVAYGIAEVPQQLKPWFEWNPMTWVVEGARNAILAKDAIPVSDCIYIVVFAFVSVLVGLVCFKRMEKTLADVL